MTTTDSRQDTTDAHPYSPERDARLDATFDALENRNCRALLRHLAEADGPLAADELADRLADGDGPREERGLRARLHHNYLPKLDDAELVDYDADRGLVSDRDDGRFADLAPTLESFESADRPVSLDALFDLLAAFRRREALVTLLTHEALSLPDLADEVAVAERGEPLTRIDADDVLEVYLSLYHTHVPKLAGEGLVEYDQDDDYVALTDAARELEPTVRSLCSPADD